MWKKETQLEKIGKVYLSQGEFPRKMNTITAQLIETSSNVKKRE